jgi:hemerythrin superfamily protein
MEVSHGNQNRSTRTDDVTDDVVALLKADHEEVRGVLSGLDGIADPALVEYFCEIREQLVRHEVAEEVVVYPAFRRLVPGGDSIADTLLAEQADAEQSLARLEKESEPAALRAGLRSLRDDVLAHAEHEEGSIFPTLEAHGAPGELRELAIRYQRALDSAPTHPHPHLPDTPPGNVVLGPIAALVDRVRDAMRQSA